MQAITVSTLTRCLTQARFEAFRDPADTDDADTLARYIWNMTLAASVDSSLHVVELALRNAIYSSSLKIVDTSKLQFEDMPCWLDAKPTLLMPTESFAVVKAKERLRRLGGRPHPRPPRGWPQF